MWTETTAIAAVVVHPPEVPVGVLAAVLVVVVVAVAVEIKKNITPNRWQLAGTSQLF